MSKPESTSESDAGYVPFFKKAEIDTRFQKEFKCAIIRTEEELRKLTDHVTGKVIAFDTETSTLDHTIKEPLVGVSFSLSAYDGYYIPFRHKLGKNSSLSLLKIYHDFLLRNQVVGFNIPFDMQMLEAEGYPMSEVKLFDAQALVFNADTNIKANGLKWASEHFLGRKSPTFLEVVGKNSTFDLISPEEGYYYAACHDDKTEVLLDTGWKFWKDVGLGEKLATVNLGTGQIEYEAPSRLVKNRYTGKLLVGESRSLNFAVTPDHRMLVHRGQSVSNLPEFRKALDMRLEEVLYKQPSPVITESSGKEDYAAFLGILFSDGWVMTKTPRSRGNRIGVKICKDLWRVEIEEVIRRSPFNFHLMGDGEEWVCSNADLWSKLKPFVGSGARTKRIPHEVFEFSCKEIEIFLKFFRYGDGTLGAGGHEEWYSTSKGMIDDLQRLLLLTGRNCSISEKDPKDVVIEGRFIPKENCAKIYTINGERCDAPLRWKKGVVKEVDYAGIVYCATVSNGTLITRRGGRVLISGNCDTANTYGLYLVLLPILKKECELTLRIDTAISKAMPRLLGSELTIDSKLMGTLSEQIKQQIKLIEVQIYRRVGYPFQLDCLPEATPVRTLSGDKTMGTLEVGDFVESSFGWERVLEKAGAEKDQVEIELGGERLVCSGRHKWLVCRGGVVSFKEAAKIGEGDLILEPADARKLEGEVWDRILTGSEVYVEAWGGFERRVSRVSFPGGKVQMVDIRTERGSYVVKGLVCHNSNRQISQALQSLGLDTGSRVQNGDMQVDEERLLGLKDPIAEMIVRRNTLVKQLTSYVDKFARITTGRINYQIFRVPCLTADAMVLSKRGFLSIRDVKVGDEVWARRGWEKVVKTEAVGKRKVWRVRSSWGSELTGTHHHPVLIEGGAYGIKDLPKNGILQVAEDPESFFNPVGLLFKRGSCKDKLGREHYRKKVVLPERLSLRLCRMLGFIDADGSLVEDGVKLCFWEEDKDLWDFYTKEYADLHGVSIPKMGTGSDHTVQFKFCGIDAVAFYEYLGAKTDGLPWVIKEGGPQALEWYLAGYLDGDGSNSIREDTGKSDFRVCSKARNRMVELYNALRIIGYKLGIGEKNKRGPHVQKFLHFHLENWDRIKSVPIISERKRAFVGANVRECFERVELVEELEAEEVYDISLEGDPWFVANGYVTHNTGRWASGNRDNPAYLKLNYQNLTKPDPAYYAFEPSTESGSILGWKFTQVSKKDVVKGKNFCEGFSPDLNVRRAIGVPDINEWVFCLDLKSRIKTDQGEFSLKEVIDRVGKGEVNVKTPLGWRRVLRAQETGKKVALRLRTKKGEVLCSSEHLFLCRRRDKWKFVRAGELSAGDLLFEEGDTISWEELSSLL